MLLMSLQIKCIIVTSNFRNLPSDNSIAVLDTSGTKWFGINKAADVQVFPILLHKKWNGLKETTCNISHGWMKYVNVSLRLEATLSGNTLCMGLSVTELMPCHCQYTGPWIFPTHVNHFSLKNFLDPARVFNFFCVNAAKQPLSQ